MSSLRRGFVSGAKELPGGRALYVGSKRNLINRLGFLLWFAFAVSRVV